VNGVSHHAYSAPARVRFIGQALRTPASRAASPEGEVSQTLIRRRLRFGIETANHGGSQAKENAMSTQRRDIYSEITSQLIAAIESDPGKPVLPWRRSSGPLFRPVNALTENAYNGINIVSLWVAAEVRQYATPLWATYKQWSELGAQVRKGEKSSLVIFYKEFETDRDPADEGDDGKRRVARASYVFNAEQVDGYTRPDAPESLGPVERIAAADNFVSATKARIEHGGESAYYRPSTDHIQMPAEGLFVDTATMSRTEGYYATLVHELAHWSGAKSRLNREMGKRFGDQAYAAEELVAEIGAAFLCAELGITQETRADHAQYLAQWLRLLKSDSKAIFTASARASEAAEYLKRFSAQVAAAA
jgi:antirestriction protein ArdC